MRRALVLSVTLAALVVGCGGDDESAFTEDEIAAGLDLRFEGNDNLYALPDGSDCIVMRVLTSSDAVSEAEGASGDLDVAVATTPDGDAGVEFGGFTGFAPDECVGPAEDDLASLNE